MSERKLLKDEAVDNKVVPKKFVPRTPMDQQRIRVEKLMEHPEKPVVIPAPSNHNKEKKFLTAIPTFVRNVMGSSAGAGSGEFHVYRHLRRKEYARQKHIQQKSKQEMLDDEFQQRIDNNRSAAEAKTAKKRAKRLKKKARQKRTKLSGDNKSKQTEEEDIDEGSDDSGSDEESAAPESDTAAVVTDMASDIGAAEVVSGSAEKADDPIGMSTDSGDLKAADKIDDPVDMAAESLVSVPVDMTADSLVNETTDAVSEIGLAKATDKLDEVGSDELKSADKTDKHSNLETTPPELKLNCVTETSVKSGMEQPDKSDLPAENSDANGDDKTDTNVIGSDTNI